MKQIVRRLRVRGGTAAAREVAAAEAFEAGASGLEERDGPPAELWIYAPEPSADAVRAALNGWAAARSGPGEGREILDDGPEPERAWSEAWKQGLEAIVISPRLAVRPPFVDTPPAHRGLDLVIAPGQAFGTGGHASTRLALELLDVLAPELEPGARVLDVGCGSGVLALGALGLGAARAVAFDLDPLAPEASRHAAHANAMNDRLRVFTGGSEALGEVCFDGVLANLLKRESLPILGELARLLAPGGWLVLSGLLVSERREVETALSQVGLAPFAERELSDPSGDAWLALAIRRLAEGKATSR
jgi:ribosomal protein L11 methyltransferase